MKLFSDMGGIYTAIFMSAGLVTRQVVTKMFYAKMIKKMYQVAKKKAKDGRGLRRSVTNSPAAKIPVNIVAEMNDPESSSRLKDM